MFMYKHKIMNLFMYKHKIMNLDSELSFRVLSDILKKKK